MAESWYKVTPKLAVLIYGKMGDGLFSTHAVLKVDTPITIGPPSIVRYEGKAHYASPIVDTPGSWVMLKDLRNSELLKKAKEACGKLENAPFFFRRR